MAAIVPSRALRESGEAGKSVVEARECVGARETLETDSVPTESEAWRRRCFVLPIAEEPCEEKTMEYPILFVLILVLTSLAVYLEYRIIVPEIRERRWEKALREWTRPNYFYNPHTFRNEIPEKELDKFFNEFWSSYS